MNLCRRYALFGLGFASLAIFMFSGCVQPRNSGSNGSSHNKPLREKFLIASGEHWRFSMHWVDGQPERHLSWQKSGLDCGGISVPVIERSQPFMDEYGNVTVTSFGPYQPAFSKWYRGQQWDITLRHERSEFHSVASLQAFLELMLKQRDSDIAISEDGILVCLLITKHDGFRPSAGVDVRYLTVNGAPPRRELVKPFAKGRVILK